MITWFSGVTEGGINTRQKRMKGALQETEWRDHKNVTEPHRGGVWVNFIVTHPKSSNPPPPPP